MITAGLALKVIFLVAVSLIWVMIVYQIVMTVAGFVHRARSARLTARLLAEGGPLPPVSILIPARNEEVVIERTLEAIRGLRYPGGPLEITVIDDGSTDTTADIVRQVAERDPRVRLLGLPVKEQGRGKSHALNVALKSVKHDIVAVYDADNRPEPESLEILVRRLQADEKTGAVLGKFRTINRNRNLLTRFINLETLAFQWIVQAGRCALFGVGILPGTNFVIRKGVLEECNGWDEAAITEDTELSVRIYQRGWKIDFAPEAVSWEEEPETFGVWLRQRTRWVRGNFYVLRKFVLSAWRFSNKFLALQLLYLSLLYYLFLLAVVISHFVFFACVTGFLRVDIPGPYNAVWLSAALLFVAELVLVLSYEHENSPTQIGLSALMYVTYCQAWLLVVFRALWHEYFLKEGSAWDKTVRFGTPDEAEAAPKATASSTGNRRSLFRLFFVLVLLAAIGSARAADNDTLYGWCNEDATLLGAHWGEVYYEGVFETQQEDNFVSFADGKAGFRVARALGAELLVYGKLRAFIDTNEDFWNNKAIYGPGVRLKPFPGYGLYLFTEYLYGSYYGIEGRDRNPYPRTFEGLEAGAAFWQRWGTRPAVTSFFPPLTGWRELYWDAIYFQRDDDNIIGALWLREGVGAVRWGPVVTDLYLRLDGMLDRNRDYWNNRIQGGVGVRFRPANEDFDLQLSCEFVGGHYLDREGRFELPFDREYVGARLELTFWFGWHGRDWETAAE
jgi:cellulose synthase/poly-beta-1,6-N-acetylglucosamine synthase-like glycosyltransferase